MKDRDLLKKQIKKLTDVYNQKFGKPINEPVRIESRARSKAFQAEEAIVVKSAREESFELDEINNEEYFEEQNNEDFYEEEEIDDKFYNESVQSEENDNEEFEEEPENKNSKTKDDESSSDENISEEEENDEMKF